MGVTNTPGSAGANNNSCSNINNNNSNFSCLIQKQLTSSNYGHHMARERQNISAGGAAHQGVLVGQDGVISRSLEKVPTGGHGGGNIAHNSFSL